MHPFVNHILIFQEIFMNMQPNLHMQQEDYRPMSKLNLVLSLVV